MKEFILPDLGEGLHEAELLQWHVAVGDEVLVDQLLVSVETAKAVVDLPSPWTGRIVHLGADVGDLLQVGQTLVGIEVGEAGAVGEIVCETAGNAPASVSVVGQLKTAQSHVATEERFCVGASFAKASATKDTASPDVPASTQCAPVIKPAVLAFAQSLGVTDEVRRLARSGAPDRIEHATVVSLYEAKRTLAKTADARSTAKDLEGDGTLKGARRQMALSSQQSISNVAAVTLFDDADISHWDDQVDMTVRCIQSLLQACAAAPLFNSHFDAENLCLETFEHVDLGIAVDTGERLLVPVLRHAERFATDSDGCRKAINSLRDDCLSRTLKPNDFLGATITLSNFGTLGGRYATPMILPPQVAILGVGRTIKTPVIRSENGQDCIVVGRGMPLSFTFDHQVATGREAAQFLMAVKTALER